MNAGKIVAIVLMLGGAVALAYGSFSYTEKMHQANLGPIELSIGEKRTVNVPVWLGVGAIVLGGVVLLLGSRKS